MINRRCAWIGRSNCSIGLTKSDNLDMKFMVLDNL